MTLEPLKPLMTPVIRIQEPTAKPRRPLVQVPQLLQVHLGVNVIEIQSAIVAGIIAAAVTRNSPEVFMRYLHTAIPSIGLSDLHFLGVFLFSDLSRITAISGSFASGTCPVMEPDHCERHIKVHPDFSNCQD